MNTYNAILFPAGMVSPFAGPVEAIPSGWLLCDGSEVSRTEFANLYNAIGVCWGIGDGSTTFNLPDLRGMFLRGVSGDSGNDEDAGARLVTQRSRMNYTLSVPCVYLTFEYNVRDSPFLEIKGRSKQLKTLTGTH